VNQKSSAGFTASEETSESFSCVNACTFAVPWP
jgi:hypothetical protein